MSPICNSASSLLRVAYLAAVFALQAQASSAIGCFVCSSFDGDNRSCEDPFNSTVDINYKESDGSTIVANYVHPCWAYKKGRHGLFPADHCIKIVGHRVDNESKSLVIRTCALDSGTLTADTEIVRISHCGSFKYQGYQFKGCVQSCDSDGCNAAPSRFLSPSLILLVFTYALRERAGDSRILKFPQKVKKKLSIIYPPWRNRHPVNFYERIFYPGTRENEMAQSLKHMAMFEIFGIIMFFLISFKYSDSPAIIGTVIATILHVFFMVTLVFPSLVSYFLLAVHSVIASKLKSILIILLITVAFEGPATNIVENIQTVASGAACVHANVVSSRNDVQQNIMGKGQMMVNRLSAFMIRISKPVDKLKKMIASIDKKTTRLISVMKQHYALIANLSEECKRVLESPYGKCCDFFEDGFQSCQNKTRMIKFGNKACSLIKTGSKICDMTKGVGSKACELPGSARRGIVNAAVPFFKAYFDAMEVAVKTLLHFHIKASKWAYSKIQPAVKELKNLKTIKFVRNEEDELNMNPEDDSTKKLRSSIKTKIMATVNFYKTVIQFVSKTLRMVIVPVLFLLPFITTINFIYKFNYKDDYKNVYITREFVKVDQDCAFRGTKKLMPFTSEEEKKYAWRGQWSMIKGEKTLFWLSVFIAVLSSFSPFLIAAMDWGIYTALYNVHKFMGKTAIDVPDHYEIVVSGNGSMSQIIQEFLEVFSPITEKHKEREMRWKECFKAPNPPNYSEYFLMAFLLAFSLFLCRLQVYLKRQKLALADHFYPERVRVRALTLYNTILQKRKNILAEMKGTQKTNAVGGGDAVMRRSLQSRGFLRTDCCKCEKFDMRVADQANVRCCIHCAAFYCIDCFCFQEFCIKCCGEMQKIGSVLLYFEDKVDYDEDEESSEETDQSEATDGTTTTATTARSKFSTNRTASTTKQSSDTNLSTTRTK